MANDVKKRRNMGKAKTPNHEQELEELEKEIADNEQCIAIFERQAKKLQARNEALIEQCEKLKKAIFVDKLTADAQKKNMSTDEYYEKLKANIIPNQNEQ